MATNRALWQDEAGIPGAIRENPIPATIEANTIVVKVHAWAINPADHIVQDRVLPFLKYPLILGEDVAGTVELVGSTATSKFKAGDRVLGMAQPVANPKRGAFQEYVVLDQSMACKMPDNLSFTEAAVFPLGINTAAFGLFWKKSLGLSFPSLEPTSTGKSVFIWGGSSSVGSNAIQLCKAAGYSVITTASAKNLEYVKTLGADKAFDYKDASAIDDIVTEIDKSPCGGIYHAAGLDAVASSCQISHRSKQKIQVFATCPIKPEDVPEGVDARMGFATTEEVKEAFAYLENATFGKFLPEALAQGSYKVAPEPQVVEVKGIEGIQGAMDLLKKGVSAKKIVVAAN